MLLEKNEVYFRKFKVYFSALQSKRQWMETKKPIRGIIHWDPGNPKIEACKCTVSIVGTNVPVKEKLSKTQNKQKSIWLCFEVSWR
jgi:hypothetical protein